jgi:cardiolipin hydrolase
MSDSLKVAFSPGDDCRNLIISLIQSATVSLDVCVFTISDDKISRALLSAYSRGVNIRVISDNDKASDIGSDVEELYYGGIEVRTDCTEFHMHHKFLIADNKTVITGSYNWTRNAAMYNQENIISISHNEICQRFQFEFERLWKNSIDLIKG